ncbi:MAG: hypothetical protein AB1405_03615 [Bdellovibrionota bacterium]
MQRALASEAVPPPVVIHGRAYRNKHDRKKAADRMNEACGHAFRIGFSQGFVNGLKPDWDYAVSGDFGSKSERVRIQANAAYYRMQGRHFGNLARERR